MVDSIIIRIEPSQMELNFMNVKIVFQILMVLNHLLISLTKIMRKNTITIGTKSVNFAIKGLTS